MKTRRFLIALYAVLLLLAVFPGEAFASGASTYHPPAITVVTYNAPEDLEIQVLVIKNGEMFPVQTERTRRAWELSFRLYREGIFRSNTFWGNDKDFAGAVLLCRSGGEEHRIPIPQEFLTPGGNKDVMTLDCRSWTLSPGLASMPVSRRNSRPMSTSGWWRMGLSLRHLRGMRRMRVMFFTFRRGVCMPFVVEYCWLRFSSHRT